MMLILIFLATSKNIFNIFPREFLDLALILCRIKNNKQTHTLDFLRLIGNYRHAIEFSVGHTRAYNSHKFHSFHFHNKKVLSVSKQPPTLLEKAFFASLFESFNHRHTHKEQKPLIFIMEASFVSSHLRLLRRVRTHEEGKNIFFRIKDDGGLEGNLELGNERMIHSRKKSNVHNLFL